MGGKMMDIDREVAERVMGWKLYDPSSQFADGLDHSSWTMKDHKLWYKPRNEWRPSTNIAQAFKVVEKLAELGWIGIEIRRGCVSGKWEMTWSMNIPGLWRIGPQADTPAEAICLAALKAVEEKP
jgi:hypothetical protein